MEGSDDKKIDTSAMAWDYVKYRCGHRDLSDQFSAAVDYLQGSTQAPFMVCDTLRQTNKRAMTILDSIKDHERTTRAICELIPSDYIDPDVQQMTSEVQRQVGMTATLAKHAAKAAELVEAYWNAVATIQLIATREGGR